MPAQYQKPDEPGTIAQAVEVWGEGPEISPYPDSIPVETGTGASTMTPFVPPYPQAMIPNYSGYVAGSGVNGVSINGSGTGITSSSQVPDKHDLTWVAGDTASFQFYFDGVCWVDVDPIGATPRPDGIAWVMTTWQSQVRSPNWTYWNYWWPPVRPYGGLLMTFVVTTQFLEDYSGQGPGTLVSLQGGTIWPGNWKWDLQTKQYADPLDLAHYAVRTWMSGDVEILTQVTMDQPYPPSHWPVYEYP